MVQESSLHNYLSIDDCPLCGSKDKVLFKEIVRKYYYLRDSKIEVPNGVIVLYKCASCGLIYKDYFVLPEFIVSLLGSGVNLWSNEISGYIDVLNSYLVFKNAESVIDVGSGDCSIGRGVIPDKKYAAVDIVRTDGCSKLPTDNYYVGDVTLDMLVVESKYNLALMIDVIEHLIDPVLFLKNLHGNDNFTDILIHTGNSDVIFNVQGRSEFDWYLKLPEHNLCFNEQSMRYLIRMLGWKVCHVDIVRSKLYYTCGIGKRIASRVLYYANLLTGGYLSLVLPGRYSNLFDLYSYNHINIHVNTKYN